MTGPVQQPASTADAGKRLTAPEAYSWGTAGDLGARLAELEATVSRVRAVVAPVAEWHVVRHPSCSVCAVLTALDGDQS